MTVPTKYPITHERWYQKELSKLVSDWSRQAKSAVDLYLKDYVTGAQLKADDATDNQDWGEKFRQQIDLMAFTLTQSNVLENNQITSIATRFVNAVDSFSYSNVKAQTAIVGINPIEHNTYLKNLVKTNIGYNVSLIQSMKTSYFNSLKRDIYRSVTKGGGIASITNAITKRTGMTRRHAELIANDQTGSIISQLDSYRAKSAGAKRYKWQSMEDQRVRPLHAKLDGKEFDYDDPNGGDHGQLPGEPIRCRCLAYPIFE